MISSETPQGAARRQGAAQRQGAAPQDTTKGPAARTSSARSRFKLLGLLFAFLLVAAACGGDSDDADSDSEGATETTAPTSTEATDTTAAPTTEATDAETTAPADGGGEDGAIAVELGEWFISDPGSLTAGTYTFDLSNTGENPHALAIVRGTSYEDLPTLENGAVDIDAVGDDFLGTTENIESGATDTIDFDLEAGDYVFFCPIQFGPNSHAAQGQVLSVTVG